MVHSKSTVSGKPTLPVPEEAWQVKDVMRFLGVSREQVYTLIYAMGVDPNVIQDILGQATLKSTAQSDAMTQLNSAFERGKREAK